jgi:signal transduction histidine kinase
VTYTDKGFLPNKSHGTHLLINELRTRWDSRRLKHLGRELHQLIIPAGPRGEFRITLKVDGHEDLSRDIVASGEKSSDYVLSFSLNANGVVTKQLSRSARAASFSKLGRNEHFNATRKYPKSPFGPIKGILYYNAHDLKRSEADVAGIRIYRDGFRVEPYGGPDDDWLGIEKWKAARAGHAPLVPTQLAGYIEISRIENPSLLDTTNRHAIIENEAFEEFTKFVFEQVQALADIINREVKRPQWEAHKEAELQKASQESLEQIGVMAVGLVHELRQPLQTINTQCALLLELLSPTDRAKVKPNIDTILKSADRMDSTIKLLSSFSRGNYVDIKDLCPGDILKQWGRHWTEEARKDGVAFKITDETEEAVLAFNENLLVSVGYILVQNAIHAAAQSQRKGEVSLALRKSSSKTLTLTVQDNGPGIDPKVQKDLFKRFSTNKPGGRGLGLFWVRKLLDLYNCLIDYKTGDDGTTFTVVIKSAKEE